jgi:hypothetical protein
MLFTLFSISTPGSDVKIQRKKMPEYLHGKDRLSFAEDEAPYVKKHHSLIYR